MLPTIAEAIAIVFVSYWWTGQEMTLFHSQDFFDPPAYIYKPQREQFLYGMIWPIVSYFNDQLGWFFTTFVSSCFVYGITYLALNEMIGSTLITFLTIGVIKVTPLRVLFTIPLALMASVLWTFTGGPLGWKIARNQ